jgi:GPI mannosyltransferase 3
VTFTKVVRAHLAATLVITCITAWFSYACFHADEYFQTIELARWKLWPEQVALLPWEHGARIRPWLQPFLYWVIARIVGVFGVRDIWDLGFVFRLVTGIVSVSALWMFLRTTLAWQKTDERKLLHLRVATLAGFLPYLYVRTSSETSSMAALTTGFSILLLGAEEGQDGRWSLATLARDRWRSVLASGFLFGIAFELRFQTAFIPIALLAWLFLYVDADRNRKVRATGVFVVGGLLALGVGAVVDRWGFGEWTFPAWRYFRVNVIEGVAKTFGADWPFAYLWLVPANVFLPALVVLLLLAGLAWARCPRHPITWATLPFFLIHNLIVHKEERFVFPIGLLSTAFVTMALSPHRSRFVRIDEIAKWVDRQKSRWPGKVVVVTSFVMMALLAFFPLGWHQHARFVKVLRERFGDDLHQRVSALPEIDLHYPTYHPGVWDVDNIDPNDLARKIDDGTAREWLMTDHAVMRTGNATVDSSTTLVYSELPLWSDPEWRGRMVRWVDWYNANVQHPLRPLRFRSLYRVDLTRSSRMPLPPPPSPASPTATGSVK